MHSDMDSRARKELLLASDHSPDSWKSFSHGLETPLGNSRPALFLGIIHHAPMIFHVPFVLIARLKNYTIGLTNMHGMVSQVVPPHSLKKAELPKQERPAYYWHDCFGKASHPEGRFLGVDPVIHSTP